VGAERLRELARDCELEASKCEEHFAWQDLPPRLRHAIQREILHSLAFVLSEVADVLDAEERAAA
jgi:hypothetical protein